MPTSEIRPIDAPDAIPSVRIEIDRFDQWVDRCDPTRAVRSCATMVEVP